MNLKKIYTCTSVHDQDRHLRELFVKKRVMRKVRRKENNKDSFFRNT